MSKSLVVDTVKVESRIYMIRGYKVMLDRDLAELYGVPTKVLNQAVKRHHKRFPLDFMFELTMDEADAWMRSRSQIVTLKRGFNIKYRPLAFTEHGILMLSSVLNGERAIQVNIAIMRTFVKLREMILTHRGLADKLRALERKLEGHNSDIHSLFDTIERLTDGPVKRLPGIGFKKIPPEGAGSHGTAAKGIE
jgi:hypothetical protein